MATDHENKQSYENDPVLAAEQFDPAVSPELEQAAMRPEADSGSEELAEKLGTLLLAEKSYLYGRYDGAGAAAQAMVRSGELGLSNDDADNLNYLGVEVAREEERVLGVELDGAHLTALNMVAAAERLQDLYDQIARGLTPSLDAVRETILATNGSLVRASEAHSAQSELVFAREEDRRKKQGEEPGKPYNSVARIIN